jgi:hypothetical protein
VEKTDVNIRQGFCTILVKNGKALETSQNGTEITRALFQED